MGDNYSGSSGGISVKPGMLFISSSGIRVLTSPYLKPTEDPPIGYDWLIDDYGNYITDDYKNFISALI